MLQALVNDVGTVKLSIVNGPDTKDPEMLSSFGVDPAAKFDFSGTVHAFRVGAAGADGSFTAIASGSTNISNVTVPVPEPTPVVLLGSLRCLWVSACVTVSRRRPRPERHRRRKASGAARLRVLAAVCVSTTNARARSSGLSLLTDGAR